ncbi:multicopper oxidase family protein [Kribbella sp. NPDC050124]|uniref:multicopper oxidase family protein n=1 Tax=Kribbella sp. NPDC050124 TaxID=3364114 RepID=UPI0037B58F65
MTDDTRKPSAEADLFPQDVDGLPDVAAPTVTTLADGAKYDLGIGPVRKRISGHLVRMLAYNGSIPGPTLRVRQGTTVTVEITNNADLEQTVHWHGLRLENRYDGVPHETQEPIPIGERFTAQLRFPDPGLYWYHPHLREDYGQEMGLYGQIIVDPADPGYWPPVNREIPLTLDDILLEDGRMPAFHRSGPTYTMMGRFGTVLLVGGETEPAFDANSGEVVRLYLTNTANTRIFDVAITEATLKLIGGDSGRYEHEEIVDSVMIAPSERAVVDVFFDRPGTAVLQHRTPGSSSTLATFAVSESTAEPSHAGTYPVLRSDPGLTAERDRLAADRDRAPDQTLQFVGEMDMSGMDMSGMDMSDTDMGDMEHHDLGSDDGVEWEDTMPEMNVMSTRSNMTWKLVDPYTGAANREITWRLRVGDRVKIRLDNSRGSDHQMHHPLHVHGAGRFLVLSRDGVADPNLVWKDTVLVRAGEVVDILLDVTNPGRWMVHCHIAEHIETGMMFSFDAADEVGS